MSMFGGRRDHREGLDQARIAAILGSDSVVNLDQKPVVFHPANEKPTESKDYLVWGVTLEVKWRGEDHWDGKKWRNTTDEELIWWAEIPTPPGWEKR